MAGASEKLLYALMLLLPLVGWAMQSAGHYPIDLFAGLPRRYDLIGALFSFGQDPRWRTRLVRSLDGAGARHILDVATGTGLIAAAIVRRRGARLVALDQSEQMLARARRTR